MNLKPLMLAFAAMTACAFGASAYVTDTLTVAAAGYIPSDMKVTVITPDAQAPKAGYPSVYLLNGYSGDYRSWTQIRPDLGKFADQYGIALVLPSGMDSWYWDAPAVPEMRMESFFTEQLVPQVNEKYNLDTNPANRAITGLSMGGHGALWLAIRHPEIWLNCGSTSGGVNILPFKERWNMKKYLGTFEEAPEQWETHTVINLVPTLEPGKYNIIFDCGSDDFFAQVNAGLHQALLDAKVPHDYISRPGKHNWQYWSNSLPYQLLYFSTKMPAVGNK